MDNDLLLEKPYNEYNNDLLWDLFISRVSAAGADYSSAAVMRAPYSRGVRA